MNEIELQNPATSSAREVDGVEGQKSLIGEGGLDLIMGGVAFIPGGGWIVSGAYFGGKYLLEATGNDFWNEP